MPYRPNASKDDRIASPKDASVVFGGSTFIEEKIDAANSGICKYEDQPIIRNRNHVLRKGYGRKKTAAKAQFAPIWNWYYANADAFDRLNDSLGFYASVYGEWMHYRHTIHYNQLPSLFMAYDIYDSENRKFIATPKARQHLKAAGFSLVPLLQVGLNKYEELDRLIAKSPFSDELREGVYIKVVEGDWITHRFKMVRQDFKPGVHFGEDVNHLGTPNEYKEPQ